MRLGLAQLLAYLDIHTIGQVASAGEALRLTKALGPDLVILGSHTDVPAPEAVRLLKGLPDAPRVIALVSRIDGDEVTRLLSLQAEGVMLRSVEQAELQQAVLRILEGERHVSPAALAALIGRRVDSQSPPGADRVPPAGGAGAPAIALTAKEQQVLNGLAQGRSNKEIAAALHISAATVKTHLSNLYAKLGVDSRQMAVARAVEQGLLG
jgi:DNA-binding NarL/FixJ family response regulator